MPRLSIDISDHEHQQIKAIAALKGQSLKQFVLSRTLADLPERSGDSVQEAYRELADFLKPSIDEALAGNVRKVTAEDIMCSARAKLNKRNG